MPGKEVRLYHLLSTYYESGIILGVLLTSVYLIIRATIL